MKEKSAKEMLTSSELVPLSVGVQQNVIVIHRDLTERGLMGRL
jgi:hypothetical protein